MYVCAFPGPCAVVIYRALNSQHSRSSPKPSKSVMVDSIKVYCLLLLYCMYISMMILTSISLALHALHVSTTEEQNYTVPCINVFDRDSNPDLASKGTLAVAVQPPGRRHTVLIVVVVVDCTTTCTRAVLTVVLFLFTDTTVQYYYSYILYCTRTVVYCQYSYY